MTNPKKHGRLDGMKHRPVIPPPLPTPTLRDRARGGLVGLAVGDALGVPFEGRPTPARLPSFYVARLGTHGATPKGAWSDDTAMALCLADSLLDCRGFDAANQLDWYLAWWLRGHNTATGEAYGMGRLTVEALARYRFTGAVWAAPDPEAAGNGSLMRLAPIPMAYRGAKGRFIAELAALQSATTHNSPRATDACRYFSVVLAAALAGKSRRVFLAPDFYLAPLDPAVDALARRPDKAAVVPLDPSGYVVGTLEAALWAFASTHSFMGGLMAALGLGGDTDTVGAVYGQLAGAYYGLEAIPQRLRDDLIGYQYILTKADALFDAGLNGESDASQN